MIAAAPVRAGHVGAKCANVLPMGEYGSSTDLETLRKSGRGKFVALGVLIAAALGAATWSFLKKGGTGNPEEAGKVLVVTRGTHVGYSAVLTEAGFEAAEGSLQAWVNKAKDEVPDLDVDGVPAIMALADRFGWGYVVFEAPGEVDFSALDVAGGVPSFGADVRWAAVSAGDFAFPHVITVNPAPSKVLRDPALPLLQALFEQEKLAALRKPESLAVGELQLRDRLRDAMRKLDDIPEAERLAGKVVDDIAKQLSEPERGEVKPRLVGETLESGLARPLPDGALLSISRGIELITRDAVRADLDLTPFEQLSFGTLAGGASARQPCTGLAGGKLEVGDWRGFTWADDGAAVVSSSHREGETLWKFDASKPGTCAWTSLGAVAPARPGLDGPMQVSSQGRVARVGQAGALAVVSVAAPGEPDQVLGMLESTELSGLRWLDATTLVATARYLADDSQWLAFFSTTEPLKVLVVSTTVFEGANSVRDLVAVPGRNALLAVYGGADDRLYRLDLPQAAAAMFANPVMAEGKTPLLADGRPTVYELDPTPFSAKLLATTHFIGGAVVSPDGRRAAFVIQGGDTDPDHDDDAEIAVVDVEQGAMKVLTRNEIRDDEPRFTADGRSIVFETRVEVPRSKWIITAARAIDVP